MSFRPTEDGIRVRKILRDKLFFPPSLWLKVWPFEELPSPSASEISSIVGITPLCEKLTLFAGITCGWRSRRRVCWHGPVIRLSCVVRMFESSCQYRYLYWSPYGITNFWTIFRYSYCLCSTYGLSFVSLYQDTGSSCNSISWRGSTVFYLVSNQ